MVGYLGKQRIVIAALLRSYSITFVALLLFVRLLDLYYLSGTVFSNNTICYVLYVYT